jgi:hypothetical protein
VSNCPTDAANLTEDLWDITNQVAQDVLEARPTCSTMPAERLLRDSPRLQRPSGRVLVTDIDPRFLEPLHLPNLEVRRHDIATEPPISPKGRCGAGQESHSGETSLHLVVL